DHQVWQITKKGIFQVSAGKQGNTYDPPQPALLFPPEPGRKFSWKGKGVTPAAEEGTQELESTVLSFQEVDTDRDKYWSIPVESRGTFEGPKAKGQIASVAYWAPKVGLVRYRQSVASGGALLTISMKLKAKSVR